MFIRCWMLTRISFRKVTHVSLWSNLTPTNVRCETTSILVPFSCRSGDIMDHFLMKTVHLDLIDENCRPTVLFINVLLTKVCKSLRKTYHFWLKVRLEHKIFHSRKQLHYKTESLFHFKKCVVLLFVFTYIHIHINTIRCMMHRL